MEKFLTVNRKRTEEDGIDLEDLVSGAQETGEADSDVLDIWSFFKKQKIKENEFIGVCNMCGQKLKLPRSTTSPLHNHLKKHPAEHLRLRNFMDKKQKEKTKNQPTLSETLEINEKWAATHPKSIKITDKICDFLIRGYHSSHLVMEQGFIDLMELLQPKYKVPHESTFSRMLIPQKYEKIRAVKQQEFMKEQDTLQSVALTTDGWTSSANDSYISLTCHYLDNNYALKSLCWGNRLIKGSHTGGNIKNVIETLAKEWKLSETVPVYVVSDNARNYQAALRTIDWEARSCVIHSLQLAIDDAKKETRTFESTCAKARSIVTHFNKSSSARVMLQQKQDLLIQSRLEVIQMVPTRWNSEYNMLKRLYEIKQPIAAALQEIDTNLESLTNEEWRVCEAYLTVLKPLKEMTDELGSEKYPTSSLVFPFFFSYERLMNNLIFENKNPRGVLLARNILKSLKSRFPMYKNDKIYVFTMILDPRFKCTLLTPGDRTKWEEDLLAEIKRNCQKSASNKSPDEKLQETPSTSSTDPTSIWSILVQVQDVVEKVADDVEGGECEKQFTRYLKSPVAPRSSNPYEYWALEGKKDYGLLLNTAKKFLPIPASQISSERQFSTARLVVTACRRRLTPAHVEQFVYLHQTLGPSFSKS